MDTKNGKVHFHLDPPKMKTLLFTYILLVAALAVTEAKTGGHGLASRSKRPFKSIFRARPQSRSDAAKREVGDTCHCTLKLMSLTQKYSSTLSYYKRGKMVMRVRMKSRNLR